MQIILLVAALSVDVFFSSVACGAQRIRIGWKTALCISAVCSGVLCLSLVIGGLLGGVVKEQYATWLCFAGLLCMGLCKLAEYGIHAYIKKHTFLCKRVRITFSQLRFILSIYNNPVMADRDHSSEMSAGEGVFFALAMSLDGFFGGFGAAFLGIDVCRTVLGNFLFSLAAVCAGSALGWRAVQYHDRDFSWLGGALFVILAFSKIL